MPDDADIAGSPFPESSSGEGGRVSGGWGVRMSRPLWEPVEKWGSNHGTSRYVEAREASSVCLLATGARHLASADRV
jgi:hypothetical protein